MAKKKIYTTKIGVCEPYAYFNKPDFGGEGFKNPRGNYKGSVTFKNEDCQELVDLIVSTHEVDYAERLEAYEANPPPVQKGKKPLKPYEGDYPFYDNGDGTTTFTFKCYASYEDKKTKETKKIELGVVDSKGKRIQQVPIIGGGSKVKIRFSLVPYGWSSVAGSSVKLQLEGVMLVELAEFTGGGDDWADDAVEGGYVASKEPKESEDWSEGGYDEGRDGSDAASDEDDDF